MKRETLFLKIAVLLIGVPVLAWYIFLVPKIANFAAELYPDWASMRYLVLIDLDATAIPFYFALYQTFKLLNYIDKDMAFSELSVKALKHIKNCAIAISLLYAAGMPLFYLMAEMDDAPGIIIIGMAFIFFWTVIGAFASVLQKLFANVGEIKAVH